MIPGDVDSAPRRLEFILCVVVVVAVAMLVFGPRKVVAVLSIFCNIFKLTNVMKECYRNIGSVLIN